ncbi:hypothetical protein Tco_1015441 [Tanacetum coccineum]|uniref:Uncharacterized protein n=1 Tax=Tanacetum coccineum TaxID=301880 RepID=A0ABQ5FKY6_9ASTR
MGNCERVTRQGISVEQEFSKKQKTIEEVSVLEESITEPVIAKKTEIREIHCLTLDDTTIYMLADRKYPLSKDACQVMLKMKLLDGTTDEVCYQLLKMIEKQAGLR